MHELITCFVELWDCAFAAVNDHTPVIYINAVSAAAAHSALAGPYMIATYSGPAASMVISALHFCLPRAHQKPVHFGVVDRTHLCLVMYSPSSLMQSAVGCW